MSQLLRNVFSSFNGQKDRAEKEDIAGENEKPPSKGSHGGKQKKQSSSLSTSSSSSSSPKKNRIKLSNVMGKIQSSIQGSKGTQEIAGKMNDNSNEDSNTLKLDSIDLTASDIELHMNSKNSDFDQDSNRLNDDLDDNDKNNYLLPEEQCDLPTFLHTKNCDPELIDETRRLLRERYAKNRESFYEHDYQRMLNDDWTVTRFLLRRRCDPKRTAKLMEECGRFRKQYKMSEVKLWEFPIEFHQTGGLFKYEPDRVGNLTVYMRVRMYRRVPEISDVFKAYILCVLEETDRANNGRGVAVVFDLSGASLQNVDLSFLSWLLSAFRNYCPKGVSYILVYNLPWFLNATCKLAMTWMSASNRRCLRFVHGDEIESFIARENLPDYLGGTCKVNYKVIPDGSRPAIEVCDRLDMKPEQALKIREMFQEYLPENDDYSEEDTKSGEAEKCGSEEKLRSPNGKSK